jgi:3'-phosphoadenosine 5'-phosphosulfate sulfotransferase (PAPS reductase)/FAD synthetase
LSKYTFSEIAELQRQPLDAKIAFAESAIKEAYFVNKGKAALAFSGGKDSTVLWHLIRARFPAEAAQTLAIFGNTGVEYPESLQFALELGREWGGGNFCEAKPAKLARDELKYQAQRQVIDYLVASGHIGDVLKKDGKLKSESALERSCPAEMMERFYSEGLIWTKGAPKSYWWCADKYGYPILGKSYSKLKAQRANIDCFLRFSRTESGSEELKRYYDVLRKVKISQACCDILKKEPSERVQEERGVGLIFKGLMAAESRMRKINFSTRGHTFKSARSYIAEFYHCNPLSIWTDADIWDYIHRYNVPCSPLYKLEYKSEVTGGTVTMKRNGCFGCYTDYGRKNSHMYVLRQTHPKLWRAVMRYGMAEQIRNLRNCKDFQPDEANYYQLSILEVIAGVTDEKSAEWLEWAIDNRPCAFD